MSPDTSPPALSDAEVEKIVSDDIVETLAKEGIHVQVTGWPVCAACKKRVESVTVSESLRYEGLKLTAKCHGAHEEVWLDPNVMRDTTAIDLGTTPVFSKAPKLMTPRS